MLKVEKICVMNLENAMRGARNPLNSWAKSDSGYEDGVFRLGPADLGLCSRLCRSGSDHRKFMRQIFVSLDITGPLYWWKEFDTYKVGTVANSTSTMHKLHSRPIELSDFSAERLEGEERRVFLDYIAAIERVRLSYVESQDKQRWYSLIQMLPSSYNQLRTVTLDYENLISIYRARKDHKLDEWHVLCREIEKLPYAPDLITFDPRA